MAVDQHAQHFRMSHCISRHPHDKAIEEKDAHDQIESPGAEDDPVGSIKIERDGIMQFVSVEKIQPRA